MRSVFWMCSTNSHRIKKLIQFSLLLLYQWSKISWKIFQSLLSSSSSHFFTQFEFSVCSCCFMIFFLFCIVCMRVMFIILPETKTLIKTKFPPPLRLFYKKEEKHHNAVVFVFLSRWKIQTSFSVVISKFQIWK